MGKRAKMNVVVEDARRMVVERSIENPLVTDALIAEKPRARWMHGYVNMVTLAGGAARMKGLSEAQLAAAVRYRQLSDAATIGGSRATDYSSPKVDVSASGRDPAEDGALARREFVVARRYIGPLLWSVLDRVICDEMSVREAADAMGKGGGNGQLLTSRRVRDGLDGLVEHFARGRRGVRGEGSAADDWSLPEEDGGEAGKAH
jgi:hypothetical protein